MNPRIALTDPDGAVFLCPGCQDNHQVRFPMWTWNGSTEAPTFQPSLMVQGPMPAFSNTMGTCHSFVTDGRIQYLADSTHELAGQTVDLPEWGKR